MTMKDQSEMPETLYIRKANFVNGAIPASTTPSKVFEDIKYIRADLAQSVDKPVKGIVIEEGSKAARQLRALQAIDALKAEKPVDDAELSAAISRVQAFNHYIRLGKTHHVEGDYCDDVDKIIRAATATKHLCATPESDIAEKLAVEFGVSFDGNHMEIPLDKSLEILRVVQAKIYRSNREGWVVYEAINNVIESSKSSTKQGGVE